MNSKVDPQITSSPPEGGGRGAQAYSTEPPRAGGSRISVLVSTLRYVTKFLQLEPR